MKIRLMGTREEIAAYVATFPKELILEISDFYPNRNGSKLGRVYIEAKIETSGQADQIEAAKKITAK